MDRASTGINPVPYPVPELPTDIWSRLPTRSEGRGAAGRSIPASELRAVAETLANKHGLLIVDEAFIDVLPEATSIASELPPATIVLQSFGKTYGLLGGTPLFRLARHVETIEIVEKLGRHGIHVRVFPDEPQWLRFGLPGEEHAWERLSAALLVK